MEFPGVLSELSRVEASKQKPRKGEIESHLQIAGKAGSKLHHQHKDNQSGLWKVRACDRHLVIGRVCEGLIA